MLVGGVYRGEDEDKETTTERGGGGGGGGARVCDGAEMVAEDTKAA